MKDLLELALSAHGGLSRWQRFNDASAAISIAGAIWSSKRGASEPTDFSVFAATREQHVVVRPFPVRNRLAFFEPSYVSIETNDEHIVKSRENPRLNIAQRNTHAKWDDLDATYFLGYTLWTYLVAPFLYVYPGFASEELAQWSENGEAWRRLKVEFPTEYASHSRHQTVYFGRDGLMRRHDYAVDILDGMQCTDYASAYREVNGIMLPTVHSVHGLRANGCGSVVLFKVEITSARFF